MHNAPKAFEIMTAQYYFQQHSYVGFNGIINAYVRRDDVKFTDQRASANVTFIVFVPQLCHMLVLTDFSRLHLTIAFHCVVSKTYST